MHRRAFVVTAASLFLAGCGGGDGGDGGGDGGDGDDDSTPTPTPTETPEGEVKVRVIYDGEWTATIEAWASGSTNSREIEGSGEETIGIRPNVSQIGVTVEKADEGDGELTVQILREGEVVDEQSTTATDEPISMNKSFL